MFEVPQPDGNRYLYLSPIKGSDWVLGISLAKSVVLAPLQPLLITLLVVLLAVGGIAALVASTVLGRLLKRLHQVRDKMIDISLGGGDLSARLQVSGSDEIGATAAAFNKFLEQLQAMFGSLKEEAARLADGVNALDGGMDLLARQAIQVSDSSTANAASIEEITAAVSRIADNADEADKLIRQTGDLSEAGARDVGSIAIDAEQSVSDVEKLAEVMASLDNRSQEISGIVNVIKGIADQTNLLALNAAIEAARAGEQGRGFAVVADEVRKLAESTAKATIEIAEMIAAVRSETALAGATVRSSVSAVRRSVELSQVAATRIQEMQQRMHEAVARVSGIALSTREQRAATNAMAEASNRINNRVQAELASSQTGMVTRTSCSTSLCQVITCRRSCSSCGSRRSKCCAERVSRWPRRDKASASMSRNGSTCGTTFSNSSEATNASRQGATRCARSSRAASVGGAWERISSNAGFSDPGEFRLKIFHSPAAPIAALHFSITSPTFQLATAAVKH
jgi:methyl-accepting chemotaxis protein